MLKNLIPDICYHSIYEIPYNKLYEEGIRLILTDLDNTLISYAETLPNEQLLAWKEDLQKKGFEIIIVSNSRKDRVNHFAKAIDLPFVKFSIKPLKRGIKKALKMAKRKYRKEEVILLGDQIMTDIWAANRMNIGSYFIEAIDKSTDIGPTCFNRKLERYFLNRIKKKYPDIYESRIKDYVGDKNDNKKM